MEDSLWYWSNPLYMNWQTKGQGIPREKLAFGVPTYGYDFAYKKDEDPQSGQIPPGYKVIQYKDILKDYPYADTAPYANIKGLGNTPRPDFIDTPGNYPYAHNIYFETPDTAVEKLKFLKYVGVQGVIIWDITGDDWGDGGKSIIKALYQAKDLPVDSSVISGSYSKRQYFSVATGRGKASHARV